MESHGVFFTFLTIVIGSSLSLSQAAFHFYVGGKGGWALNPSEDYNHWAGRNRFQVNDTLIFKYKKGSDSVLQVNIDDYTICTTSNPITKMENGYSIFTFERSGPFFFISGNKENCEKGQKLHLVVLAVRNKNRPSAPPPRAQSPAPSRQIPAISPTSPPPAPSPAPRLSPVISPALSPAPAGLTQSPEAVGQSAGAPAPGNPAELQAPESAPSTAPAVTVSGVGVALSVTLALSVTFGSMIRV